MRALLILVVALMFGLAGGYAWSTMEPHSAHAALAAHAQLPKPVTLTPPPAPNSAGDREWAARGDDDEAPAMKRTGSEPPRSSEAVEQSAYYPSCRAAWGAGHAPIYAGQPGYRSSLDGDGDGIACEPYHGN